MLPAAKILQEELSPRRMEAFPKVPQRLPIRGMEDMPRPKKQHAGERTTGTLTVEELLNSGLVGIWKDRTDIGDSLEFARKLREQSWKRRTAKNDPRFNEKHFSVVPRLEILRPYSRS